VVQTQMFIVQSGNIVRSATSDDPDPTPGYVFIEMAKLSNKNHSMCEGLANALLDRLTNNSLFVKKKAIRCIKHLVREGNPNFRIIIQKHAEQIRPCVTISGPPDVSYGDSLYAAIRSDASDVLDMIYRPVAGRLSQNLMTSVSSSSYGSYSGARSMSSADSVYASVSGGGMNSPRESSSFQSRFQHEGGGGGDLTNFGSIGGYQQYSRSQPEERPAVQPTAAQSNLARGIFGGGSSDASSSGGSGSSSMLSNLLDASKGSTVPTGQLQSYVQQLKTEGSGSVAEAVKSLDNAAHSAINPAMQMRILTIVQALAEGGVVGASNCGSLMTTLSGWKSSPVFSVRNKTQTAVTALHRAIVTVTSGAPAPAAPAAAAPSNAPVDLLGLGADAAPAPQQPQAAPAAADPFSDLLFGGGGAPKQQPSTSTAGGLDALLGMSSTPQKPAAPAQDPLLGLMSTPQKTSAAPAADPFSFTSTPQKAAAPAPAPSSSFDFISGGAPAASSAAAPSQPQQSGGGGDLFSGLSLEDGSSSAAPATTTSAPSSSFDFISGGDVTSAASEQPAQSNFDFLAPALTPTNVTPDRKLVPPSRISADAFKFDESTPDPLASFGFNPSASKSAQPTQPAAPASSGSAFSFTQASAPAPAPAAAPQDTEVGAFDGLSKPSAFSFI